MDAPTNINARHSVPWESVSTPPTLANPHGSLRAAAARSKAPSAPWWHQGDIAYIVCASKVTLNGVRDFTDSQARTLAEYRAASAAGWDYTSVRAGAYGSVWVFRRGEDVLTAAGAAALATGTFQRPQVEPGEPGYDSMVTRQMAYCAKFADWLRGLPASTIDCPSALWAKVSTTAIGQWVAMERSDSRGLHSGESRIWFLGAAGGRDVSIAAATDSDLLLLVVALGARHERPGAPSDRGYDAEAQVRAWRAAGVEAGSIVGVCPDAAPLPVERVSSGAPVPFL
jgi:hypothetical protein